MFACVQLPHSTTTVKHALDVNEYVSKVWPYECRYIDFPYESRQATKDFYLFWHLLFVSLFLCGYYNSTHHTLLQLLRNSPQAFNVYPIYSSNCMTAVTIYVPAPLTNVLSVAAFVFFDTAALLLLLCCCYCGVTVFIAVTTVLCCSPVLY